MSKNPRNESGKEFEKIVNNMLNPGEKDLKPKQYKDRIKDGTDMYGLIKSGSLGMGSFTYRRMVALLSYRFPNP